MFCGGARLAPHTQMFGENSFEEYEEMSDYSYILQNRLQESGDADTLSYSASSEQGNEGDGAMQNPFKRINGRLTVNVDAFLKNPHIVQDVVPRTTHVQHPNMHRKHSPPQTKFQWN